jgi:hypothetical protein
LVSFHARILTLAAAYVLAFMKHRKFYMVDRHKKSADSLSALLTVATGLRLQVNEVN